MRGLQVALECRIENFQQGIGTAILSLAHELCDLPGNTEHYTLIVFEDHQDLFATLPANRMTVLPVPRSAGSAIRGRLNRYTVLRDFWRLGRAVFGPLPISDGIVESRGFDVVHFPTQVGYVTKVPSIYQPWDLQHVHLPQFFPRDARIWRDRVYKAMCRQAKFVSVQTEWGKIDLVRQYSIDADKIAVIPWGSVLSAYPMPEKKDVEITREKYGLPGEFLFFPAITWPHKNHELIIRALAYLKQNGFDITLVCTGDRTDNHPRLVSLAKKCGVEDQVKFLGFVTALELQSIYSLATAMIFPSRFEGFGLPVLEAFQSGLPVLCARATVLPEVASDAALFFSPDDPIEAAETIMTILSSPAMRTEMVQRGHARAAALPIRRSAEQFRELYHRTALDAPLISEAFDSAAIRRER